MVLLAFLIGVVAGLRAMTAPAVVAWAAHRHWLTLNGTPLSLMGSTAAVGVFTLLAVVELIGDKLPTAPSRTEPLGLSARVLLGGLCGGCIAASASQSIALGAAMGGAGGLAGTFAGYELRTRLVRALRVPDFVIAVLEDAVAVATAVYIVSRP